ncbi:MAG: hypothetical protein OXF97_02575 [Nitrospira sp.]|nr:hypothetical protein [Nitrospira sp.]
MLHRLALRVIPQLNATVTEPGVRRRKRRVMLAPGLVAFVLYRLLKDVLPLSDPLALLAFSGVLSTLTAYWAYVMGRGETLPRICRTDNPSRLFWVGGWIGFAYGVQLSLLVLAILALFVDYNFLVHPEGPVMMALIIPCTSVARDAFEIGHVVRMEAQGARMVTFPDGGSFRELLQRDFLHLAPWVGAGIVAGGATAILSRLGWAGNGGEVSPAILVCIVAAFCAHGAFLSGKRPLDNFPDRFRIESWLEACRFWTWPCLTFAFTYYLVQFGFIAFVLQVEDAALFVHLAVGGVTAGVMAGYGYFLGVRVFVETQTRGGISEGLKRCPFVMEILAKTGWVTSERKGEPVEISQGEPSRETFS